MEESSSARSVVEKYRALAAPALGAGRAGRIWRLARGIAGSGTSVRALRDALLARAAAAVAETA